MHACPRVISFLFLPVCLLLLLFWFLVCPLVLRLLFMYLLLNFCDLFSLDVSYNGLTAFPVEICENPPLSELSHLYLANNSIPFVPPAVNHLTALTYVDLSSNVLTVMPGSL